MRRGLRLVMRAGPRTPTTRVPLTRSTPCLRPAAYSTRFHAARVDAWARACASGTSDHSTFASSPTSVRARRLATDGEHEWGRSAVTAAAPQARTGSIPGRGSGAHHDRERIRTRMARGHSTRGTALPGPCGRGKVGDHTGPRASPSHVATTTHVRIVATLVVQARRIAMTMNMKGADLRSRPQHREFARATRPRRGSGAGVRTPDNRERSRTRTARGHPTWAGP